jgi:hypothetical protein
MRINIIAAANSSHRVNLPFLFGSSLTVPSCISLPFVSFIHKLYASRRDQTPDSLNTLGIAAAA